MADTINGLITEAKRNKYSLIPSLSENDVVSIWEAVSQFVVKQMTQQKGVTISGLGTFTFSQRKLDIGNSKFILIQRPVFVLSEKFAQTHALQYTKHHTSGQIPIMPLNFTILANETPFNRDTVEMCVKEVLQALARSLAAKKNIEFDFSGIGRLLIRESRVKMRFLREFLLTLDSSGNMESVFRPSTGTHSEFSIISASSTPRPSTSNTLILPKIVELCGGNCLTLESVSTTTSRPTTSPNSAGTGTQLPPFSPAKMPSIVEEEEGGEMEQDGLQSEPSITVPPLPISADSIKLVPKLATLFSTVDEGNSLLLTPALPSTGCSASKRPRTPAEGERHKTNKPHFAVRPSTCSHLCSVGQELCYLCHQRATKNIPVDVTKERRKKEVLQDTMLQEYQHQKDLLALAKEQASKTRTHGYNKEIASFNSEEAEKKRVARNRKSSEFHPSYVFQQRALTPAKQLKQQAYCCELDDQVTCKQAQLRAAREKEERVERDEQLQLTKELAAYQEAYQRDRAYNMTQYERALAEQVAIKHELSSLLGAVSPAPSSAACSSSPAHSNSARGSCSSARLRPLSLPKPTIILPFSHTKTMTILKDGKMKMIRVKPAAILPLDSEAAQQPVFGVHDVSLEKQQEQQQRARSHFLEQLSMVEEKQRRARERALRAQQEEASMLHKTRQGLIKDLKTEKKEKLEARKALEETWNTTMMEKQRRLLEELQYARDPSILLHQQCEKYLRCKQCQRRRHNNGKSNLLCESRYISGSRLMV